MDQCWEKWLVTSSVRVVFSGIYSDCHPPTNQAENGCKQKSKTKKAEGCDCAITNLGLHDKDRSVFKLGFPFPSPIVNNRQSLSFSDFLVTLFAPTHSHGLLHFGETFRNQRNLHLNKLLPLLPHVNTLILN